MFAAATLQSETAAKVYGPDSWYMPCRLCRRRQRAPRKSLHSAACTLTSLCGYYEL